MHGDIKPLNIMRNQYGTYCLIDFDASETFGMPCGRKCSTAYIPPEMVCKDPHSPLEFKVKASAKIDIWSLGCILYHMLTAEPLFSSKYDQLDLDNLEILEKWTDSTKEKKLSKISCKHGRNLVSRLLTRQPELRNTRENHILSLLDSTMLSKRKRAARGPEFRNKRWYYTLGLLGSPSVGKRKGNA